MKNKDFMGKNRDFHDNYLVKIDKALNCTASQY